MIIPPYLKEGDAVALIAPARFMDFDQLASFQDWVNAQGWNLILSPNIHQRQNQFGGSPTERINDILWALNHPQVKAVFMARGGYGTMQLLPQLKGVDFTSKPKWWVGFSDITALHLHLQSQGIASMHGPMAMQFSNVSACSHNSKIHLAQRLMGQSLKLDLELIPEAKLVAATLPIKETKWADLPLWGGNLSMVFSMLASGYKFPKQPFVLFLEDLDEYLYHIDRMMQALHLSGSLENAKAILVGTMTDMKDHDIPFGKNAKEIISDICNFYKKPMIWGLPFGHQAENIAIKMGLDITFDGSYLTQS